jgi:uncharacterized protein with ParB-like and HNH nuclease domain
MKEILGTAKNIRALLSGSKYGVDYFQREYRWQKKHVGELINDLAEKFLASYAATHERSAVDSYGHYFLGSIIISERDAKKFIIDCQQRLTTLSLLLIHVHHLLADHEQKGQLADLIFSQRFGKRSFNLDVPERTACMEALYAGESVDDSDQPESVTNILGRYHDISDLFPDELTGTALPYFADWLIENVHLVEITAYSDEDASTIFETMNDRGLNLTPTDMLKGYLLTSLILTGAQRQVKSGSTRSESSRALEKTRMLTGLRHGSEANTRRPFANASAVLRPRISTLLEPSSIAGYASMRHPSD